MKRIIISVTNDLSTDQRVLRTCACFNEMGYEILLIGRKLKYSLDVNLPYKTMRFNLFFNTGFLFYAEYNLRLFFKLLLHKKDLLFANDLDTLLANFLASKLSSCKLVYDSHEYFSEVPELIAKPGIKSFWEKLERFILPKLKNVITVNSKLAEIYSLKYKIPVTVIKNVPETIKEKRIEPLKFLKSGEKMILYQGALNMGRGIELMIESMIYLENYVLVLVGEGDLAIQLKDKVVNMQLNEKVIFMGKLLPEELVSITPQAAIGLSLEENLGLNYRYCLPNKVFDYINAKIPVLASELPLLQELIQRYKVGECLSNRNPKSLAALIDKTVKNKASYREALAEASLVLNWENEKKILIEFIHNIE